MPKIAFIVITAGCSNGGAVAAAVQSNPAFYEQE